VGLLFCDIIKNLFIELFIWAKSGDRVDSGQY
jgi:hypothetical protein